MEWTLGITDQKPKRWRRREPRWDDETLTACDQHSFMELMDKLCDTALARRRPANDHKISGHIWYLEICSESSLVVNREHSKIQYLLGADSQSKDSYCSSIIVIPERDIEQHKATSFDFKYRYKGAETTKLSRRLLPQDKIIKVTYDLGTTTTLYLKVLSIQKKTTNILLQYFEAESETASYPKEFQKVPAYHWPKEQQVDAAYPNFSKVFMGHYVPVFSTGEENEVVRAPSSIRSATVGSASLGPSAKLRSERDVTFCTIETSTRTSDLMYAGLHFWDMNEFLELAEKSWTPRDPSNDPDHLSRYSYNSILRILLPKISEADDIEKQLVADNTREAASYGPKQLLFRFKDTDDTTKPETSKSFDFAKAFPKTMAQFSTGKFRWFQYSNGILRVMVGRGVGQNGRDFESGQVLRTWRCSFASFHELLCAVEASWVYCNKPLEPESKLSYFYAYLGPSRPRPPVPIIYGKAENTVQINTKEKWVTALAVAEESNGQCVVYCGHADGILTKWALSADENASGASTLVWKKKLYHNDFLSHESELSLPLKATFGVAGIAVRWVDRKKSHRVYTWTDAYNGYPRCKFEERKAAQVACLNGTDGKQIQTYSCNIGDDEDGDPAYPSIATVVFCKLRFKGRWVDSMVVGLHCISTGILNWANDYSDFDVKEAAALSKGNILPFIEYAKEKPLKSWRGHYGMIRAMAVVPDKYLLSFAIQPGHGYPDAMILWDLANPGVPLNRYDFWDPRRSLLNRQLSRLTDVDGIAVSGNEVLLCCKYGDRIAAVTFEDNHGRPSLKLRGYGSLGNCHEDYEAYHGRMSMDGKFAVMANERVPEAWLFEIGYNYNHAMLDRREGPMMKFEDLSDEEDEENYHYNWSGQALAVGKVCLPKFGGNNPRKRKIASASNSSDEDAFYDGGDFGEEFENGGPVTLAMNGKWLITGYANGAICRTPFLPTGHFKHESTTAKEANHLTSCSFLPSDEWHVPVLEDNMEDDDDESTSSCLATP